MHVVDPANTYYKGIKYRAGSEFQNISLGSAASQTVLLDSNECLDSSQMWFCRDMWVKNAEEGVEAVNKIHGKKSTERKSSSTPPLPVDFLQADSLDRPEGMRIPNALFRPAKILINPRSVTTYAGVSHAMLAKDLFADVEDDGVRPRSSDDSKEERYLVETWEGAPESFSCLEQRTTGGRLAEKTERTMRFLIDEELTIAKDRKDGNS
jgi:hypothetical protein